MDIDGVLAPVSPREAAALLAAFDTEVAAFETEVTAVAAALEAAAWISVEVVGRAGSMLFVKPDGASVATGLGDSARPFAKSSDVSFDGSFEYIITWDDLTVSYCEGVPPLVKLETLAEGVTDPSAASPACAPPGVDPT